MTNDKIDSKLDELFENFYSQAEVNATEIGWEAIGEAEQEAKKQILELIVEAQIEKLEYLATSDPRYTMAALKDELAALKAQLQDSPSKDKRS